jgi:hypothetical protein
MLDIAKSEAVERELDAMIECRSREPDPAEREDLWKESVSRYNARIQEELRAARGRPCTRARQSASAALLRN